MQIFHHCSTKIKYNTFDKNTDIIWRVEYCSEIYFKESLY